MLKYDKLKMVMGIMKNLKSMIDVKDNLKDNFNKKLKDPAFNTLVSTLKVDKDILYKNTSNLEDAKTEVMNCSNCKGLKFCKNEIKGYKKTPKVEDNYLSFSYEACKYQNKYLESNNYKKNLNLFDMPTALKDAKIKDIYTDDKSRIEVIKYIDNFYNGKESKGLYLHGNFGAGKTYLIAALFNELAKKGVESSIIYFPEFLRTLKASFQKYEESEGSFSDKYEKIKKIPLLLIDDIGAENVTAWGRDEILGTILQYRMNENLPTFFTSNLTINELENHLSMTSKSEDKVKARRIIERIKYLTKDISIIGKNRR